MMVEYNIGAVCACLITSVRDTEPPYRFLPHCRILSLKLGHSSFIETQATCGFFDFDHLVNNDATSLELDEDPSFNNFRSTAIQHLEQILSQRAFLNTIATLGEHFNRT